MRYWTDVLPGLTVFGLGLALMVAPLTATVLAAAPDEHAGHRQRRQQRGRPRRLAARGRGAAGRGRASRGAEYADPVAFDAAYRSAMLIVCAVLLAARRPAVAWLDDPQPGAAAPGRATGPLYRGPRRRATR